MAVVGDAKEAGQLWFWLVNSWFRIVVWCKLISQIMVCNHGLKCSDWICKNHVLRLHYNNGRWKLCIITPLIQQHQCAVYWYTTSKLYIILTLPVLPPPPFPIGPFLKSNTHIYSSAFLSSTVYILSALHKIIYPNINV